MDGYGRDEVECKGICFKRTRQKGEVDINLFCVNTDDKFHQLPNIQKQNPWLSMSGYGLPKNEVLGFPC